MPVPVGSVFVRNGQIIQKWLMIVNAIVGAQIIPALGAELILHHYRRSRAVEPLAPASSASIGASIGASIRLPVCLSNTIGCATDCTIGCPALAFAERGSAR